MPTTRLTALCHRRVMRAANNSTLFSPWARLSRQIALSSGVIEDRLSTLSTLMDDRTTIAQAMQRMAANYRGVFFDPVRSIVRSSMISGFTDGAHYRGQLPYSGFVDVATKRANARAAQVETMMRKATKKSVRDNPDNQFMFSEGRAKRAVRFEAGTAYNQGLLTALAGMRVKKEWATTSPAPCDECLENEDAGPIHLDDEFPSGDVAPLLHPNCECVLSIQ